MAIVDKVNRRKCPYCSKTVSRTSKGYLRSHGEPKCPGSGLLVN